MVAAPKPLSVETANSSPLWFYLKSDPLLITQNQHVYTGVTKHPQRNSLSSYPTDFFRTVILSGILETAIGIYIFFLSAPLRTCSWESPTAPPSRTLVTRSRIQHRQHVPCPIPFLLKSRPLTYTNFGLFNFILCNCSFDEPCLHRFGKRKADVACGAVLFLGLALVCISLLSSSVARLLPAKAALVFVQEVFWVLPHSYRLFSKRCITDSLLLHPP